MKKSIESVSNNPKDPFAHLIPIVDELVQAGNELVHKKIFHLDPDGWRCLFKKPIDFNLLERKFNFPNNIELSRQHDSILDINTWVEIRGGFEKIERKRKGSFVIS